MSTSLLLIVIVGLAGIPIIHYFFLPQRKVALRSLLATENGEVGQIPLIRNNTRSALESDDIEKIKNISKRRGFSKPKHSMEERFFHAGIFTDLQKRKFLRLKWILPICCGILGLAAGIQVGGIAVIAFSAFGVLLGFQLPYSILTRRIARRNEEIMYYLPLVIEQIVIGVSSSLDIGPCVQRVVQMADERDTHNPVTELLRHCQYMVRSGVSLEEALQEIGRLSGHTELKHSFMALSQVVRHGGEITRQLQELADAVSGQRETRIEGKIKKLELEATGPVGLVFLGFLTLLLIGIGIQVMKAFPS